MLSQTYQEENAFGKMKSSMFESSLDASGHESHQMKQSGIIYPSEVESFGLSEEDELHQS
jgi:hypothetical protein